MGTTSTQRAPVPNPSEGASASQRPLLTPKKERRFSITIVGGTPA
jgi:hypothetical protein